MTNSTMFSPLMTSSNDSLKSLFSNDFMNDSWNPKPATSQMTSPIFTNSTIPSFPTSFGTMDSFCFSAKSHVFNAKQTEQASEIDPRSSQMSKLLRNAKRANKNSQKLFSGLTMQNNMLIYLMLENLSIRNWLSAHICSRFGINLPHNTIMPIVNEFPKPEESSDKSSPTLPK
ncbi:hypothetical protein A2U01_0000218 [Trifolium medium]|uniref:Uncharacterized protein n=1 Tax=Trifolium medium TaxID=97028 RepID=A0A392LWZ1_9FABA|nr:hypothetical protein [Trifolium medium]